MRPISEPVPDMKSKLTLRMNATLIRRAKSYAKAQGKSVSQMVAYYLRVLARGDETMDIGDRELPPITRSLYGCLADSDESAEDADRRHREEKYK